MGFAGVILLGTVLLMLPFSSAEKVITPFHEALFTATSAVCVTGLVVKDTGSYWSLAGQTIILALIQIGGLGVVTVAASVSILSGKKISLKMCIRDRIRKAGYSDTTAVLVTNSDDYSSVKTVAENVKQKDTVIIIELSLIHILNVALSEVWAKGGEGGIKLAEEVIRLVEEPNDFTYAYKLEGSIEDKLNQIVQKVYGGKKVVLTANAQKQAKQLEALGFGNCPICVAKTQYSLTDDQTKLGAPTDFEVTVRNLKISAGAGFIVALTGEIMTMPGLPKVPRCV